jgi:hypothetical protein
MCIMGQIFGYTWRNMIYQVFGIITVLVEWSNLAFSKSLVSIIYNIV